jgi:hypothetical protein
MPKRQKEIFLARLMQERDKFELLLNRVGFTRRMTMKGVSGKWSIKDMLAHILAYELYIADRMNEILHEEPYAPARTQNALDAFLDEFGYPDFGSPLLHDESPNEWVTEKYKNVSLEDLVTQEIQAFASIMISLEKMPEETLNQHNLFDRIANNTYRHYREHSAEIKHWLRSSTAYNRR